MKALLIGVVVGVVAVCSIGCKRAEAQASHEEPRTKSWEYKVMLIEPHKSKSEKAAELAREAERHQGYPNDWAWSHLLFLHETELNALGKEGWELVSAIPEVETMFPLKDGRPVANTRTKQIRLVFKRSR